MKFKAFILQALLIWGSLNQIFGVSIDWVMQEYGKA